MTGEERRFAEMLLAIKAKASQGISWTRDEQASIDLCFEKQGEIRVLAACCVLTAMRPQGCDKSVGILRETIERERLPSPYTEASIYEALNYVEGRKLAPFHDALFLFIEQSLVRRSVSLINTIALLGKLARRGEARSLALLQSLANDDDTAVRDTALNMVQCLEHD